MGTPQFAVPSLEVVSDGDDRLVLVVTQPDRPKGRGREPVPSPVKITALERKLEIAQPEKVSDAKFLNTIEKIAPDLVVVVAFGQLLPKALLDIPPMGCVNTHASILPKYRGAAPINWAILKGEKITGITTMLLDEGMDSGDILLTKETPIGDNESAGELAKRLSLIAAELLIETIGGIKDKSIRPIPQDHSKKTLAPILKKEDGFINWSKTPIEIKNHVRGMSPWPVATTRLFGETIKIYRVEELEGEVKTDPGVVVGTKSDGIVVSALGGNIVIKELQAPGKKRMLAAEFIRGRKVEVGTKFGGDR
jgi:methionyl-tRNA formyltransferase